MKKPAQHLSIHEVTELTRYQDVVEKRIRTQRERYENYKYAMQRALDTISNMTRSHLELGVAVIDANATHAGQQLKMDVGAYCKAVQYQANKPFVCMVERQNSPTSKWELSVPKIKDAGMENLVAPLLIIGKQREVEKNSYATIIMDTSREDGIHYESHKQGWTIWFVGEESEDMRSHWLEMCRTDTVFRLCLRMPALPVDVSQYGL
jgi:hypothetical protein